MTKKCPLGISKERVRFDIRGTSSGADPLELIFDQKLAYECFAETENDVSYGSPRNTLWWFGKNTYFDTCGAPECSGNGTSSLKMFAKVALRFLPLNGVVPKSISYTSIPRVHQSTAEVCPQPLMTSGAMYSSVPTKELVLKFAIQDLVSIVGSELAVAPLRPKIIVGAPPGSDCLERSKSDSMICPDWCRRISGRRC